MRKSTLQMANSPVSTIKYKININLLIIITYLLLLIICIIIFYYISLFLILHIMGKHIVIICINRRDKTIRPSPLTRLFKIYIPNTK